MARSPIGERSDWASLPRLAQFPLIQPHLRYHRLSGELEGVAAVSLTHSHRITLTVIITEKEIILLDTGSHDEVYR